MKTLLRFPARLRRQLLLSIGFTAAGAATGLLFSAPAHAQAATYPDKPARIVVPFPPGGSTDLLARQLAERLTKSLGQPFIVENKPGAGGTVGADLVAKSPPDGYTILIGVTGTNAISASLYSKLPFDPARDLVPITMLVNSPLVLVVNDTVPARDVRSFIEYAKANPGRIAHGSPGNGTSMHLTGEMFALDSGTRLNHVPYKGSAGAVTDLLGGQINAMFADLLVLLPHIQAGKVKALGVTSRTRHPMLPDVPTIAESGLAGFEALSWQGLFVPAGTPPAVIDTLNKAIVTEIRSSDMADFFSKRGFVVSGDSPAAAAAFIGAEIPKWARIVKASGAKVD